MSWGAMLLITVLLMLIGAIPSWPHSKVWAGGGLASAFFFAMALLLTGSF